MKKNILFLLCAALGFALSLPVRADAKPVLLVLTSHGELGDTGKQTGFFLSELTHPLEAFEKAGFAVEMASIKGGEPPVDGLDLKDAVNARYWNDSAFRAKLSATKKLSSLDPKGFSAVFFAGGHGTMWDFPDDEAVQKMIREFY
jgi:putative intracellular protease/amidase